MAKESSIRRKLFLFSVVFYPLILIIGGITFVISMRQDTHKNTGYEIARKVELERIKLETSVNSEIVIVLKMASSPLIINYFLNPSSPEQELIARQEIESYRSAVVNNIIFWANDIDKVFWFNGIPTSIIDPESPDEYWYNMTMYNTESYNFNINYNPDLDTTNLWINAPVFDSNGRPIGIVGTGIDLTEFLDSIYSDFSGKEELYFFNLYGEITGAQDTSLVYNKANINIVLGEIGTELLSMMSNRRGFLISGEFSKNNKAVAFSEVPALGWYIAVIRTITILDILTGNITILFVAMMLVILAIFVIYYVFISGLLKRTTDTASHVFKRLEKNDLSVQVEVNSQDEIGGLLLALGGFLEKLRTAFTLFNQEASTVTSAVNELSASAKQITTTANEQSASVAEIVSTMENNKNLSTQVSVNTSEVAELAEKTQRLSRRGADLHTANEDMMLEIKEQNSKILEEIRNLHDVLSRIDETVQLIDSIADKTKLIAFNAALEASSSGEAGYRFAVVAGEIRRFADNVVESALEIKERVTELQNVSDSLISEANVGSRAVDLGYNRMVEQKEVYKNIVEVSQDVAVRSQQISSLSKQQEQASEQVFATLKEISLGVNQFVSATTSTSATVDKLNTLSIELKETLAKYMVGGKED